MAGQTIGGLFRDQVRGEKALAELKTAGFSSAQISEVDDETTAAPKKLGNPFADFFNDHQSTGSEFRDNLAELGMTKADADYFEDGVARGGALVTVKADSRQAEAITILEAHGADLGSMASTGRTSAGGMGAMAPSDTATDLANSELLELRAERLAIDKVRVASGAARIRKQVVSEQQSVDVAVSHEELVIERHPVVDGTIGGTIGKDETINVPLSREEVRVGKETYVTEEVEVGKRAVAGTERVSDTIKHEELVVDADAVPGSADSRPLR